MDRIKQGVDRGQLEIAKLDHNNQPQKIEYSELLNTVKFKDEMANVHKSLAHLSAQQKYQWSNFKRLRANKLYRNGQFDKAIQLYVKSLIGFDFSKEKQQNIKQIKIESMYPILVNVATCFYRKKQLKKSLQVLQKILKEYSHFPALYKKVQILIQMGEDTQAKQLTKQLRQLINSLETKFKSSKEKLQDINELKKILKENTQKQKKVYQKMFDRNQDQEIRPLISNSNPEEQEEILVYKQGFFQKICQCCSKFSQFISSSRKKKST